MKRQPFASLRSHARWILVAWIVIVAAFGATLAVLRRPQTAESICRLSSRAVGEAVGLSIHYQRCSLDALTATLTMGGVSGLSTDGTGHSVSLESIELRLRPLQALAGGLEIERLKLVGLDIKWIAPPGATKHEPPKTSGTCWARPLKLVHVESLLLQGANAQVDVPGGSVDLENIQISSTLSRGVYRIEASARGAAQLPGYEKLVVKNMAFGVDIDVPHDRLTLRSAGISMGAIEARLSGVVNGLCKPEPDLQGQLYAPISELVSLSGLKIPNPQGELELTASYRQHPSAISGVLTLKGFAAGGFKAPPLSLRVSGDDQRLKIENLHLDLDPQSSADISGSIGLKGRFPLDLDVQVKNGPFAKVLDDADISHAWADFRATVSGHLQGHLALPFLVTGSVAGDIVNFVVDDAGWDVPGKHQRMLTVYPKVHVQTDLRIDKEALRFEHAELRSPLSQANVDAMLNYDNRKGLKLTANLAHLELSELKQIVGLPWGGAGAISGTVEGPYAKMLIAGKVKLDDFQLMDVDYGAVSGPLRADISGATLSFDDLDCQKGRTSYTATGTLDLSQAATLDIHLDVAHGGRVTDLLDSLVALQPAVVAIREALAGELSGSAEIHGPAKHLAASAKLDLPHFTLFDRGFRSGVLTARLEDGRTFDIDAFHAEEGEGGLRAHGTVTLDGDVALAVEARSLSVEKLLWLEGEPNARGALGFAGRIDGRLDAPLPSGEVTIEDLSIFDVPVGTAKARLSSEGRKLTLIGSAGDEMSIDGSAELTGRGPYHARFEGQTKHLERYLASRYDEPLNGELNGSLDLSGQLLEPERSKGAFEITHAVLNDQRLRLESTGHIHVGLDSGALTLAPTTLSAGSGGISLGGTLSRDNQIDATFQGDLDARMLEGLVPKVERLSGRVSAQASVRGPSDAPSVVGSLTFDSTAFSWTGLPLFFSHVDGTAEFSQRKVLLSGLRGELNGGGADVSGELLLRGFSFGHYDLNTTLKGVSLRIPDSIPSQVSGTLLLTGDPDRDLRLTGTLDVLSARYSRNFDIETLIESFSASHSGGLEATGQSSATPMQYDILLRGGNDLRVENDVAHLKLEGDLRLKGNVDSPALLGSITARNGVMDFRGYRYHVSQAAFSFTDPDQIAPEFDINADTDARQYRVFVHAFGTPQSYRLQLSSQPVLTQEDIAKLLTIGVTSQDAVAATGAGGTAGYGADVLWNMSGLHDQVRRLLPRNDLIKDLSFSPGSAFIEATGQVEPVMRIETRVLTDRLRLSAQLPLAEAAGKRIAAEYLLDDHLSVQGEWDTDYTDYGFGNFGADLRARWEFGD